MKGKVKWFNVNKRYGYITDENGEDVFVHVSNIKEGRNYVGLNEGDEVEFEVSKGKKGNQASDVALVSNT